MKKQKKQLKTNITAPENKTNNVDEVQEIINYDDYKQDPYAIDKASKIPDIIKALFIKFWFAGAVYYFVGWGITLVNIDQIDTVVILGLIMGLVTDLMVNHIFRLIEKDNENLHKYMFFGRKKWYSVFINIAYSIVLCAIIAYTYHFINVTIVLKQGLPEGTIVLGAEPLLYGLFYIVYDIIILLVRNLIVNAIRKRNDNGEVKNV